MVERQTSFERSLGDREKYCDLIIPKGERWPRAHQGVLDRSAFPFSDLSTADFLHSRPYSHCLSKKLIVCECAMRTRSVDFDVYCRYVALPYNSPSSTYL